MDSLRDRKTWLTLDGHRLTIDAAQKSSIVVPSAMVVPLTSTIQNSAVKSGRARISQRRRIVRSPGRAFFVGHVITGASSDHRTTISRLFISSDYLRRQSHSPVQKLIILNSNCDPLHSLGVQARVPKNTSVLILKLRDVLISLTVWWYKPQFCIIIFLPKASPIPRARKKIVRKCKRWNDH